MTSVDHLENQTIVEVLLYILGEAGGLDCLRAFAILYCAEGLTEQLDRLLESAADLMGPILRLEEGGAGRSISMSRRVSSWSSSVMSAGGSMPLPSRRSMGSSPIGSGTLSRHWSRDWGGTTPMVIRARSSPSGMCFSRTEWRRGVKVKVGTFAERKE